MATRKRTIQPNIWQDPDFGRLSQLAQLIFVGCITQADDEGRLLGHPAVIRSMLFPYGFQANLEEVMKAITEIVKEMKNVVYYEIDGNQYIQLRNWEKHQVLREDRRLKSTFPPPPRDLLPGKRQASDGQAGAEVSKQVSKEASNGDGPKTQMAAILDKMRLEFEEKGLFPKKM